MSDVKPVAWQRFDEIGEYDSYMGSVEEGDYVKYDDALTTVTALQAEIESMRKDSERYKWLRSRMPGAAYRVEGIIYSQGGSGVDAGIDAAIAKEKQQESLK